jgi:monovalent cation:H+ antiporter-2, CPA2 family
MHELGLILTLTAGLGAALIFGFLALKARLPAMVGYLVAGLIIGLYTPGFVADRAIANQLAEIGVILLMFGVGLHFDPKDLLAVRRIAICGALGQMACSTVLGYACARWFGWTAGAGWIFGVAVAMASTVVLTRVLAENGHLQSPAGRVAVGWLVVEDICAVFILVALPALAGGGQISVPAALGIAALKLASVAALTLVAGARLLPRIMSAAAGTRSRELFTLTVLVIALGIAVGSAALFGVSMALGAFLAGMVVGRSDFGLRAATEALPMRDAFAVLFFVSVGMLFDPQHLLRAPVQVASAVAVILVVNPAAALAIVLALGYGGRVGLRVAGALGQIGEFSFILATVGTQLQVLPAEAMHTLVAASIFTIAVNPLVYRTVAPLEARLTQGPAARWLNARAKVGGTDGPEPEDSAHHAVVVGYGPVGQRLSHLLAANGIGCTVIELNAATLPAIRRDGFRGVHGDAASPDTLRKAGVARASTLIVSTPDSTGTGVMIRGARELNPHVRVLARAAFLSTADSLRSAGADEVFVSEAEVAISMSASILDRLGATPEEMDRERERARTDLYGG